ncbi:MAG TPA: DUF1629 domain-containing protein [Myxococcaceae bacterium]|jgi:hypothetical protein
MASEPRFFVLLHDDFGKPHDTTALMGEGFETGDAPTCPVCNGVLGLRQWLPPYRVELTVHGKEGAGDFVECVCNLLISERMADAFRSERLMGLEGFQPVDVVKMNAHARRLGIPRYFFVKAAFGQAAVDEARSRIRRVKPIECEECRRQDVDGIHGFRIQAGSWDGLDVFRPRGLQSREVVSERFADFVQGHGLTNIKLVPTEQFVWDPLQKGPPTELPRA